MSDPRALKQVLWSGLTVALSGRCDQDILRLLLAFPEDEKSWFATKELCGLPRAKVYSLMVLMSRNLNLRNFIYKVRGVAAAGPDSGGVTSAEGLCRQVTAVGG